MQKLKFNCLLQLVQDELTIYCNYLFVCDLLGFQGFADMK